MTIHLDAGNASMVELGKTLGPTGIPPFEVKKEYDALTAASRGEIVPAVITYTPDRKWSMRLKTPPTSSLIRTAVGVRGANRPGHETVATLTGAQLRRIAERKLPDLNTSDIDKAMRIVAGTARSMGVRVDG
ncbi:uL11 family ribosomal protein [Nocardia sp. CDC160]|uniref:uL11 family ribosomal protein n=1 Tax=Nocardia sp. CDC160 TaxID=3112166 RepID=UPI002DBB9187|nr:50S ribosomal protein L11 [Nocardia sp. CDC160]MEC3920191.1 50S ribosomal protein L11 [Nocardia sp. CDC160]